MLYPITNEKRIAISLNGLWHFNYVDLNYDTKESLKQHKMGTHFVRKVWED